MSPSMKAWIKDAAERVLWTAVQGFASALLLADALNLDALSAAGLGAMMAVLALVKSIAAAQLGGDTAQLGAKTYSYTEPGPGSAGPEVAADAGQVNLGTVVTVLVIVLLVILILRLV